MVGLSGAGDASFEASFESDSDDEFEGFTARDISLAEERIRRGIAAGEFTRDSDDEVNTADFADHDADDKVDSDNDSDDENKPALPPEWTLELVDLPDFPFVDAANVGVNNVEQCRAMTAKQLFSLFFTDYLLRLGTRGVVWPNHSSEEENTLSGVTCQSSS